jgi:hypothetical protein
MLNCEQKFKADAEHWECVIANAKKYLKDIKFRERLKKVFDLYPTTDRYEQMAINNYTGINYITIKKGELYFMGKPFDIGFVLDHYTKMMYLRISITNHN